MPWISTAFEDLSADRTRKAERRCQPVGKMPAVPHVVEAAIAHRAGVIGMAGAGETVELAHVERGRLVVLDESAERGAGRPVA